MQACNGTAPKLYLKQISFAYRLQLNLLYINSSPSALQKGEKTEFKITFASVALVPTAQRMLSIKSFSSGKMRFPTIFMHQ